MYNRLSPTLAINFNPRTKAYNWEEIPKSQPVFEKQSLGPNMAHQLLRM